MPTRCRPPALVTICTTLALTFASVAVCADNPPVAVSFAEPGQMRVTGVTDAAIDIAVPVRWSDSPTWTVRTGASDGETFALLEQLEGSVARQVFVYAGTFAYLGERHGAMGDVVAIESTADAERPVLVRSAATLGGCGDLETRFARAGWAPAEGAFTAPTLEPAARPRAAGPWTGQTTALAARMQQVAALDAAWASAPLPAVAPLSDEDPSTALALAADQLVRLDSHPIAPGETLVVSGRDLAGLEIHRSDGAVFEATRSPVAVPLDGAACVVLFAERPVVLDAAVLVPATTTPTLEGAASAWAEEALVETDPARLRLLADAILRLGAEAHEPLIAAVERTTDASGLRRAVVVADRLPDPARLTIAAAIAGHSHADDGLVTEALATLDAHPRAAAAALLEQLQRTEGEGRRLTLATQLARLPVRGSMAPLLRALSAVAERVGDDSLDPTIDAVASTGARVFGVLPTYVSDPDVPLETRRAMLRAMLRAVEAGHRPSSATDPLAASLELAYGSADERIPLIAAEIAVRLGHEFTVDAVVGRIDAEGATDIEIALGLRLLPAGPETLSIVRARAGSEWPTIRIAATEVLAGRADESGVADDLTSALDDSWPEIYGAALDALVASGDERAALRALEWLEDDGVSDLRRSAGVAAVVAQDRVEPWQRVSAWLADGGLSRSDRRVLLAHWLERAADPGPALDALLALPPVGAEPSPWRDTFIATTVAALEARTPSTLDGVLPTLLDDIVGMEEPSRLALIEVMAFHDTPEVRAALQREAERADGFGDAARSALRRLDGGPAVVPEPAEDMPEL